MASPAPSRMMSSVVA
ncbi:hypothetical protein E2C01_092096 [Portunus trituberculatus]|uniref:Uncharacterized protein n=1 Tax=Portunus trituberculatus TaxID=210409 RepID=A0A5B7JUK6_PORTR|nr:hypothetical protein [Portunus trituberculatus]